MENNRTANYKMAVANLLSTKLIRFALKLIAFILIGELLNFVLDETVGYFLLVVLSIVFFAKVLKAREE